MKLHIITTGGTIDKIYFDAKSDYQVGSPVIGELLERMGVGFEFTVESAMRKDSLDLTDADRAIIRDAVTSAPQHHVLVTHGTDTMIDTAVSVGDPGGRTIVFTGAMQPASQRRSDAVFNIGFATAATWTLPAGVYIAINGKIFDPAAIRKNRDAQKFELK